MTKLANAHYWSSTQLRSTESSWSEMSENCSFWTLNITSRDPWWEFRQSDISHDRLLNTMTGCLLTGPRLIAWVVSCLDGDRNAPDCDPNAPDCDRNAQAIWWLYPAASFLFSWRFISPRSHHPLQHPIVRINDQLQYYNGQFSTTTVVPPVHNPVFSRLSSEKKINSL